MNIPDCTDENGHDWDLDYTDEVYGTYRGVEIDGATITVDTASNKVWDEAMKWSQVECQRCGFQPDMAELNIDWE